MPTTATLLTPIGRGAVATILVRGPAACRFVERHFQPSRRRALDAYASGRILFGRWGVSPGEDIVVCRFDNGIELHCHGGRVASHRILDDLASDGCQIGADPAVQVDDASAIQREALAALIQARTERTAAILLDQYHGALERECSALQQLAIAGLIGEVQARLDALLNRQGLGLHLAEPWKVVLAGRPNVGKSSLMNALLGYQRAIVFDQPGTTRDAVATETALAGWPIELSDTAGLRSTTDELELKGIDRTRLQVASADCLVLVFDASQRWAEDDQQLCNMYPDALVVHNKVDLAIGGSRPAGLCTCATTSSGVDQLITAVTSRLVPVSPSPQTPIPFTQRQVAWLQAAAQAARPGDACHLADCLDCLLSGEQLSA